MSSQQINNNNVTESNITTETSCCLVNKWNNLSSNIKGLTLSAVLFTSISTAQIIFALSVNSIALLADAAAMFVDVACYIAAIYGETIPKERATYKRICGLVTSFISIAILFGLSIKFLHESVIGLTAMPEIEWSQSAASQNNNPFSDVYGRNASGVVQFGLPETVRSLEERSAPFGILEPRIIYNGISATMYNGILPYDENEESACPDIGPGDSCDMDDVAEGGTVMLVFGLLGLIIDMICLGYAFVMPRLNKQQKNASDEEEPTKEEETAEEEAAEEELGETQNVNTLAAYAHVAADLIRSFSSIVAASYILSGGRGAEYADDMAGAVSSCTIVLGSIVGLYEWGQDLREHLTEKTTIASTTDEDSASLEQIRSELEISSHSSDVDNTNMEIVDMEVVDINV